MASKRKFTPADLLKHNDILLAVGIALIIGMLLLPIPAIVLDILLTVNLALAITIMMVTIYTDEPLQYSTFPMILLVSTLFRLGLNISATRLILTHGQAGEVIHAFGNFVVGGNFLVGILIFIILVVINFMVITNGAGRVAEVSARFTLDAMPGKQLSIDADLNAGLIDEKQAKKTAAAHSAGSGFLRDHGRGVQVCQRRRDGWDYDRHRQHRRRPDCRGLPAGNERPGRGPAFYGPHGRGWSGLPDARPDYLRRNRYPGHPGFR